MTPWADVELNGEAIGTTPLRKLTLAPGTYALRFSNPSYQPLNRRVTVRILR